MLAMLANKTGTQASTIALQCGIAAFYTVARIWFFSKSCRPLAARLAARSLLWRIDGPFLSYYIAGNIWHYQIYFNNLKFGILLVDFCATLNFQVFSSLEEMNVKNFGVG